MSPDAIIDGRGSGTTMKVDKSGAAWVTIIDEHGTGPIEIDPVTHALNVVNYPHHEIHEGEAYNISAVDTDVDSGAVFSLGFTTGVGSSFFHLVFDFTTSAQTEITVRDSPGLSGGTAITAFNRNRTSTNTSACTCTTNPAISGTGGSGTVIFQQTVGVKANTGGQARDVSEWILNSGTNYLFVTQSAAANNIISTKLDWYEHESKS